MHVYVDASISDNAVGIGWHSDQNSGNRQISGMFTSMEGEYFALLEAMRLHKSVDDLVIHTDCRPIISKMESPDSSDEDWFDRYRGFERLCQKFNSVELVWIPREQNERADRLAYEAIQS